MQILTNSLTIVSALLFMFYGAACFYSKELVLEFERYGFGNYRTSIALLEIIGAAGLIIGFVYPLIFLFSSGGLTILMFGAILVRRKINDPIIKWLPAIILFAINFYLFCGSIRESVLLS